ncbi:MAG: 3'-5' exonuclease, partial [Microterricola sp.]
WENVFVVGVSEGLVPISYAQSPEQIDEERRLLYVGITRAKQRLALSWGAMGAGQRAPRERSRFLAEMERLATPDSRNPGAGRADRS